MLGATLFVALVFSGVTAVLSAELALSASSVIISLSGLLLGAGALLISRLRSLPTSRFVDIAGILMFFGFAAAIICDKTEILRLWTDLPQC